MSIQEYHTLREKYGFSKEEVARDLKTYDSYSLADQKETHEEVLIDYNRSISLGRALLKQNKQLNQNNTEFLSKIEELTKLNEKYKEENEKLTLKNEDLTKSLTDITFTDHNIIEKNLYIDLLFNKMKRRPNITNLYEELEKYDKLSLGTQSVYGKEKIRQNFIYLNMLEDLLNEE